MDIPSPMAWLSTCGREDELLFDGLGAQFFDEAYQQNIEALFGARNQVPNSLSPSKMISTGTQKDGNQDYPMNSSGDQYGEAPAGCHINRRGGTIENGRPAATKRRPSRAPEQSRDHIIAERKRREKLNQRFIALSALVPGLKRMDKTSVLGDAVKYIKQLQERVQALEQETAKISVGVNELDQVVDGACDDGRDLSNRLQVPVEIEARFIKKSVLIKILCEKGKGVHAQVLNEIEKLHLSITDAHAIQLCDSILVITIIAQMEMEFDMTAQRLARILRSALG